MAKLNLAVNDSKPMFGASYGRIEFLSQITGMVQQPWC
jgi:hypothetical protein